MDTILCDELLEEIFRRLPPRSTFSPSTSAVSLVSKRWLRLYRSTRSTLHLRLIPGDNCTPHSLSSFLSQFPHLSHLLITKLIDSPETSSYFSDHLLSSVVASSCPRTLTHLSLSLKLETLSLSLIRRGDYGLLGGLWRSCCDNKKLTKLQLHFCDGVGDDTSDSSFYNCLKGLKEMELRSCDVTLVNDVLTRLAENCTSLESLLIEANSFDDAHDDYRVGEGLHRFITRSCCDLRKLDLGLPHGLEDNHLLAVAERFRGLLSLRLGGSYRVTGEGLKSMSLAMSKINNKLEELALPNCDMESGLLTTLGQSFRNLRKLDLSYNDELLEDEELIPMLASLNCLRELIVRGCGELTNASVVSMFKSCEQLESVVGSRQRLLRYLF